MQCCKAVIKMKIFTKTVLNIVIIKDFEHEKSISIQNEQNETKFRKNEKFKITEEKLSKYQNN